jgi:hypothetical protein
VAIQVSSRQIITSYRQSLVNVILILHDRKSPSGGETRTRSIAFNGYIPFVISWSVHAEHSSGAARRTISIGSQGAPPFDTVSGQNCGLSVSTWPHECVRKCCEHIVRFRWRFTDISALNSCRSSGGNSGPRFSEGSEIDRNDSKAVEEMIGSWWSMIAGRITWRDGKTDLGFCWCGIKKLTKTRCSRLL